MKVNIPIFPLKMDMFRNEMLKYISRKCKYEFFKLITKQNLK